MALIRIEAARDEASGKYFLEIYRPHDAPSPFVTTQPRYQSAAAAENDAIAILAAAASMPRRQGG
ncbi:hypothetical protein LPC08_00565 [Roseomonas sp. OT10]|uniref:hypothetical protein n=1 Tax=Roseomonas cutis TaxID=2897332 RepID=UPI001E560BC8|nr:hypothetical protein [Roseomonas sp. OT10]UFN49172.1 hypothetical protein LPC08_00565 [Roseomonas sp. OT10]